MGPRGKPGSCSPLDSQFSDLPLAAWKPSGPITNTPLLFLTRPLLFSFCLSDGQTGKQGGERVPRRFFSFHLSSPVPAHLTQTRPRGLKVRPRTTPRSHRLGLPPGAWCHCSGDTNTQTESWTALDLRASESWGSQPWPQPSVPRTGSMGTELQVSSLQKYRVKATNQRAQILCHQIGIWGRILD